MKQETKKKLNTTMHRMVCLCVMAVVALVSIVTVMAQTVTVTVKDGSDTYSFEMTDCTLGSVLEQAVNAQGMPALSKNDLAVWDENSFTVTVRRSMTVTVAADGKEKTVNLHEGDTVSDALQTANVLLGQNDLCTKGVDTVLQDGDRISVVRRYTVAITADGKTSQYLVNEGTVQNALGQAGVQIGADDLVLQPLEDTVTPDMEIQVQRVSYRDVTTTESVDYETVIKSDSSMYVGETKVETEGQEGERTIVTREKLVDGKVVETEEISNEITKEPVDKVVLEGTKKPETRCATITAGGTVYDENGNLVSYKKALTGRCTAYTGDGYTSTGMTPQYGVVAVDPNEIPYGTQLYICSPDGSVVYGYAVAGDTGGFIYGNYILADLYMDTYSDCANFGVREMTIYVL